jgi:hypothetical protein
LIQSFVVCPPEAISVSVLMLSPLDCFLVFAQAEYNPLLLYSVDELVERLFIASRFSRINIDQSAIHSSSLQICM